MMFGWFMLTMRLWRACLRGMWRPCFGSTGRMYENPWDHVAALHEAEVDQGDAAALPDGGAAVRVWCSCWTDADQTRV